MVHQRPTSALHDITFYDYGIEDIISGQKSATIRSVQEDTYAVNEIVALRRQNGDLIGRIRICTKEHIRFAEISEAWAAAEHWCNANAIRERLFFTYGPLQAHDTLVRYGFLPVDLPRERGTYPARGGSIPPQYRNAVCIVSTNAEKLSRLSAAWRAATASPVRIYQPPTPAGAYTENHRHNASAETLALMKARYYADTLRQPVLATDQTLLICDEKSARAEQQLRHLDIGQYVSRSDACGPARQQPAVLRTGLAFVLPGGAHAVTTIAYCPCYLCGPPPNEATPGRNNPSMPLNRYLLPRHSNNTTAEEKAMDVVSLHCHLLTRALRHLCGGGE